MQRNAIALNRSARRGTGAIKSGAQEGEGDFAKSLTANFRPRLIVHPRLTVHARRLPKNS